MANFQHLWKLLAAEAGWRQGFGVSYGTFVTVSTVMSVTSLAQISHNDWLVTV
jgi:hypothetical protein